MLGPYTHILDFNTHTGLAASATLGYDGGHAVDGPALSSVEANPESVEADNNGERFQISSVDPALHVGSLNPADWTTYVHVYPNMEGGITIQYWHLFTYNAYNGWGVGLDNHDADWDASMQVVLNSNLVPVRAYYSRHEQDDPGLKQEWGALHLYQGTHPLMVIDQGGHGAYADHQDCEDYFSLSNHPYGICDAVDWESPDAPNVSGTVWETWPGGVVRQLPGATHQIVGTTQSDGSIVATPVPIVNVGEYNPDVHQLTQETYPSIQGAGYSPLGLKDPLNFYPLNGQTWIMYSGRWGGHWTAKTVLGFDVGSMSPRGPVFQGWANRPVVLNGIPTPLADWRYWSWYWGAADAPAPSTADWKQPPGTSLALGTPQLGLGGLALVRGDTICGDFCAGDQTFTLTPTQNGIAAQYGQSHTYFRIYRAGGSVPSFDSYYDPFTLPSAAGQYTLDYYTLDALNNVEDYQTQTFTVSTLTSLAVAPAGPTVAAGRTQQFTATGTYSEGAVFDLTGSVHWASATPGAATIRASGLARGVSPGASTISATLGPVSGSTVLTVGPAEPLSVSLADTVAAGSTTPVTLTFTNVPAADIGHLQAWITCGVPSNQAPCGPYGGFTGVPGSTAVDGSTITFGNQTQNLDGSYSGSGTVMLIVTPTYTGPAYLTFTDMATGVPVGTNTADFTIATVSETLSVSLASTVATGTLNPVNLTFANVPAAGMGALNLTLVCGTPAGPLCGQYRGVPGSTTVNGITITFANKTQNADGTYSGSGTVMYTAAPTPTGTAFAKFADGATGAEAWDPFATYTVSETLSVSLAPTVTDRAEFPVILTFANVPAVDLGNLQAWLTCGVPTGPTPCGGYTDVPGSTTVDGTTITFANQTQNPDGTYSGSGTVMYLAPTTYTGPAYMTFADMSTGVPVAANTADFTIAAVKGQTIAGAAPGPGLATLVLATVVLWVMSTMRHVGVGRPRQRLQHS